MVAFARNELRRTEGGGPLRLLERIIQSTRVEFGCRHLRGCKFVASLVGRKEMTGVG